MNSPKLDQAQAVAPDFLSDGHGGYPATAVATWPARNRVRYDIPLYTRATLDAAVAEAVAAERERCARLCEQVSREHMQDSGADACATAIRRRS